MATYLFLNLTFMTLLAIIMALWRVRLPYRPLLTTLAIILVLTFMFDAIFIHIGIYAYNPDLILPFRITNIPPEDFAYAFVAAVFIPYLWELSKKPKNRLTS